MLENMLRWCCQVVKECFVQLFWSTVPGNYVTTTK